MSTQHHIEQVGIIGAGAMGRGIAQLAVCAGATVQLYDRDEKIAEQGLAFTTKMIERAAAKGRMTEQDAQEAIARLSIATNLVNFQQTDLIIEAVVERLDIKQALFEELEDNIPQYAVLATNTSSLSVTEIGACLEHPERFLGLHFFNPAPLMKLIEVVPSLHTARQCVARMEAFARTLGHEPILVADTPGFLVNHAGRAFVTEAFRMLEEDVAPVETIDQVLREAGGFRMGPFELMDLTGLDVTHPATEKIYSGFYHDPRLKPSPIARQRLSAGFLGNKSANGFYSERKMESVDEKNTSQESRFYSAWLGPSLRSVSTIRDALAENGIRVSDTEAPLIEDLTLVAPVGGDATQATAEGGHDPRRTIALDPFTLAGPCWTIAAPVGGPPDLLRHAVTALTGVDRKVLPINDSIGFVFQRTICAIVNLACAIAQKRIASPDDIDKGVKLALGYPFGPLEWGDKIGPDKILSALEGMMARSGDARYRPSLWLRRRAELGLSLLAQ